MNYIINIDKFEGPMDLLLHLVKKSNIDIYEINIENIINQYFVYIKKMEQLNLDIASAYLVMAAELIEIKASLLLPKPEIISDEYEEDPKEKLIRKLVEYQKYKALVPDLIELEQARKEYFTKEPSDISDLEIESDVVLDLNMNILVDAFKKFLDKKEFNKPLNTKITTKEYSVDKRSNEIIKLLKLKKELKFSELFEFNDKGYIVITFLSVLSLAKENVISLSQNNNFEDILVIEVKK